MRSHIGKWIVCERGGGSGNDPRTAVPVRIINITSASSYNRFNTELIKNNTEYAYFETYSHYFKTRNINLDTLPVQDY